MFGDILEWARSWDSQWGYNPAFSGHYYKTDSTNKVDVFIAKVRLKLSKRYQISIMQIHTFDGYIHQSVSSLTAV
jgi:hypothetical protein